MACLCFQLLNSYTNFYAIIVRSGHFLPAYELLATTTHSFPYSVKLCIELLVDTGVAAGVGMGASGSTCSSSGNKTCTPPMQLMVS